MTKTLKNILCPRFFLVMGLALVISAFVQMFQISLDYVIDFHRAYPQLTWALPVAGIFFWLTILIPQGKDFESTDQIMREVQSAHKEISPWLTPFIWIRTLWSHLFGASVGREGTALQMAGSLSDLGSKIFKMSPDHRLILLRTGLAAGLASAYQTPWAGFIFALELGGTSSALTKLECLIASWISFLVANLVFHHPTLSMPEIDFSWEIISDRSFWCVIAGLVLMAPLYRISFLLLNRAFRPAPLPWRWFLGGALGLFSFIIWSSDLLQNLGTDQIDLAFSDSMTGLFFVRKTLVTAMFNATSWFGGDFTPNMAAGAVAGNSISNAFGFSLPILGAAIGLFLPVAFTHRILATGWVMTLEYFGWKVALLATPAFIGAWILHEILERLLFRRLRH